MKLIENLKEKLTLDSPLALEWEEWDQWHEKMRKEKPLAYWLNETVPDFCKDFWKTIISPFTNTKAWIRYRVFDRYHIINTGLEPGYYDCDERMLHGMFNMLVDFVEVEKAWMNVVFSRDNLKKYQYPWFSTGWLKFKSFRCKEAGIDYLNWEYSLASPTLDKYDLCESQSATAAEILDLYKWWTEVRPNRPDPIDASGWSNWCEYTRSRGYKMLSDREYTTEEKAEQRRILDLTRKLEEQYAKEDEDMLIRLIKIRRSLWT